MLIEVPPLSLRSLEYPSRTESSAEVRERVAAARIFSQVRLASEKAGVQAGSTGVSSTVAGVNVPSRLEAQSMLAAGARSLLRRALVAEGLSGRAYTRIIRLARTIADLDALDEVTADHVAEALALRLDYRRLGLS